MSNCGHKGLRSLGFGRVIERRNHARPVMPGSRGRLGRPAFAMPRDAVVVNPFQNMSALAQKSKNSSGHAIGGTAGAFIALIVLVFVLDLRARHHAAIEGAKESASNYAEVLAEHTARVFEAVDRSLREAQFIRMNLLERRDGGAAGDGMSANTANEALRHLRNSSPLLVSIGWTNAQGDIEAHSNSA